MRSCGVCPAVVSVQVVVVLLLLLVAVVVVVVVVVVCDCVLCCRGVNSGLPSHRRDIDRQRTPRSSSRSVGGCGACSLLRRDRCLLT